MNFLGRGVGVMVVMLLAGCGRPAPVAPVPEPVRPADAAALAQKAAANYPFDPATPLEQRVGFIPAELLEDVRAFGGDSSYVPYHVTDEEMQTVTRVLAELPDSYRAILQEKLQGIYFVKGWRFGMADWLLREDGSLVYYLVFGPETLHWTATMLLTFKENTAFALQGGPAVLVDCGGAAIGLDYTMLHEVTHIVDMERGITPYADPDLLKVPGFVPHSDRNVSAVWQDYDTLRPTYNWPYRGKVNFYGLNGGPQLPGPQAQQVYENLGRTPCASLYSTLTCVEDLAELATLDIMVNYRNMPYKVIVDNQTGRFVYEPMPRAAVLERLPAVRKLLGYGDGV